MILGTQSCCVRQLSGIYKFGFFFNTPKPHQMMFGLSHMHEQLLESCDGGADRRRGVCQRCRLACRCVHLPRCVFFDSRPGGVMPPRISLALVLCFVFPCLVQGVDILMAPNGNGSLFSASFARRSSDNVDIYNKK
jgi:hypothetical protein